MALVRAKVDVYLNVEGYRSKGDEFEYGGPDNHNLELVKDNDTPQTKKAK